MSESSVVGTLVAPLRAGAKWFAPLAVLVFVTYGYFVPRPAWNQNSRLALTRALVEERAVTIDSFHETTGDKSFRDGHFYSDKAPGASMLSVIPYALVYGMGRLVGAERPNVRVRPLDPDDLAAGRRPAPADREPGDRLVYNGAHRTALYLCGLLTTTVAAVAGLGALVLVLLRAGESRGTATAVALIYGLGTPAFAYSTVLYGHQLSADLLLIAFAVVVLWPERDPRWGSPVLAGAACGLAVMVEYPAVIPAAAIAGFGVVRHGPRFGLGILAAAVPAAAVLAAYHGAAFGHPLATGYDFVYRPEFAEGMRQRYGIGAPDPAALWAITFGSYRGLAYLSPVLILAAWGLGRAVARGRAPGDPRSDGVGRTGRAVALGIVAYYLLLNSGYYMWDGGASLGPRHCVPMLPFLALGLAPALRAVPRATVALSVVSVVHMVAGAAASPEVPQFGDPIWGYAMGRLWSIAPVTDAGATNLGLLLGLPGLLSLVPLGLLWWWLWPPGATDSRTDREP